MKINKGVLKTAVSIILTVFILAVYVFLCVTAFKFYNVSSVLLVALLLLGAVLSLFIHSLIHELGHLVFGLTAGLYLEKIRVLIFELEIKNGTFKFKIKKPSFYFGYTSMLPKNDDNYGEKLTVSSLGGLVFSFVFTLLNVFIAIKFATNAYVFSLFGIYYVIGFYVFIINFLPLVYNNDGALIYDYLTSKQNGFNFKTAYQILAKTSKGVKPCDLGENLLVFSGNDRYSQIIQYHKYLSLLATNFDEAEKQLNSLLSKNIIDDEIYFAVKKEALFIACVKGDSNYANLNGEHVVDLLGQDDCAENYRIHAVYRIFTGEKDWAKLIVDGGINALSLRGKTGYEIAEIGYLKDLKNQLNQ